MRLLVVAAVIGTAAVIGWWWQRGRVRHATGRFTTGQLRAVGLDPDGADVLAVLLSSPTCAPCRAVERVLGEVADTHRGLRWVSVDAGAHLDLARAHHVMRVPTLFLLDRTGRILARTSGVPTVRDLERVITERAALH